MSQMPPQVSRLFWDKINGWRDPRGVVVLQPWTFPFSLPFATNNASVRILPQMPRQPGVLISGRWVPRAGLLDQRVIRFFLTVLQRIKQENTAEVTSGRAEEVEQMDPREVCWWLSQSLRYKVLGLQVVHLVMFFYDLHRRHHSDCQIEQTERCLSS